VDTDELARQLVQPGQPALAEIKMNLAEIFSPDGRLNAPNWPAWSLPTNAARQKLEAILHPRIRERWQAQVEIWRAENCPARARGHSAPV
jgi:dephospho-CoA kinase